MPIMSTVRTMSAGAPHALCEAFLRVGYYLSSAIIIPYCLWVYAMERGSFSRIPVTLGVLLLCTATFFLYFTTTIRFRLRFSRRKALVLALLVPLLGIGFVGVLSIILFSYLCEAVNYRRERRGLARMSPSSPLGVGLVVALAVVVFPLLNEMYFRGAQTTLWHPDYNKQNVFFEINEEGFRGPRIPIERNDTPRLLFLGDSTAFGWPYRYEESFPFLVKTILEDRGIDVEILNAASIGQGIGQIRHQLPYFLEYRPDVTFLMTGVHYLRADEDYQRILREGVSRETRWRPFLFMPPMLVELAAFSVTTSPIITGLSSSQSATDEPSYQSEGPPFETHLRAVLRQVSESGTRLHVLDYPTSEIERRIQDDIRRVAQETGTEYIPLGDLIGDKLKDQMFDGIHPNRVGHRLIAEEIARVVASALAANAPDSTTR